MFRRYGHFPSVVRIGTVVFQSVHGLVGYKSLAESGENTAMSAAILTELVVDATNKAGVCVCQ